jgi:uncharacterized protein (DUF305 family)
MRSTTDLLVGVLLVTVGACGRAPETAPVPATTDAAAAAIAKASADSARHPYTSADIEFMSGMIPHHAQAITMSRWAPTHGGSAAIQRLAERIINAQEDEIATMQRWLRDRRQPVPDMHAMHHMEHMPLAAGMLTPAQMKQLDAARGDEFDRLFLTFMIQHHRGAVAMVQKLFSSYGAGQDQTVFKFASDVNVDQSTEIARMESMLVDLISTPRN